MSITKFPCCEILCSSVFRQNNPGGQLQSFGAEDHGSPPAITTSSSALTLELLGIIQEQLDPLRCSGATLLGNSFFLPGNKMLAQETKRYLGSAMPELPLLASQKRHTSYRSRMIRVSINPGNIKLFGSSNLWNLKAPIKFSA